MPDHVTSIAKKYGIDPGIFRALVQQESGGNQSAVSPAGAIGQTQLMPGTAASLGVNPHDPIGNLVGGARYLKQQLDRFGGNYHKALAAYNAGPGAVQKYGGVPPFAETQNYVKNILANAGGSPKASASSGSSPSTTRTTTRMTPGVDRSDERRALILNWLQTKNQPGSLVQLATGLQGAQDTPGHTVKTTTQGGPGADRSSTVQALAREAQQINDAKVPYQWGGGHQAKAAANSPVTPLDCSGAVSRVLGINPRVSGQFQHWGRPGDGGSSGVTVYSNNHHVFMKINGHFFGTSRTNPGGGAGWIPQAAISPDYLRGFTARHL